MPARTSHGFVRGLGITLSIIIVVAVVAGLLGYFSYQRASAEMKRLKARVEELGDVFASGDAETIRNAVTEIDASAHAIHREASSPLWAAAEWLPVWGSDVKVARTLADVLVELDEGVLLPLGENATYLTLDGYLNDEGLSFDGIVKLAGIAQDAQPIVEEAQATIEALPTPQNEKLKEAVDTALDALSTANEMLGFVNSLTSGVEELVAGGTEMLDVAA